jgi:flagellar motility protein MotE (MotC chaperone)
MPQWIQKLQHFMQVAGTCIKGNWALLLLGVGMIFALVVAKNKVNLYNQLMTEFQNQQAQNVRELEQLRSIQRDQLAKQEIINRRYQEVLDRIQQNYQEQLKTLDAHKESEIRRIISENHDDPAVMANEINSLFGIPIYPVANS